MDTGRTVNQKIDTHAIESQIAKLCQRGGWRCELRRNLQDRGVLTLQGTQVLNPNL